MITASSSYDEDQASEEDDNYTKPGYQLVNMRNNIAYNDWIATIRNEAYSPSASTETDLEVEINHSYDQPFIFN